MGCIPFGCARAHAGVCVCPAQGDGTTLNTAAIAAAFQDASKVALPSAPSTVLVAGGVYLTGQVRTARRCLVVSPAAQVLGGSPWCCLWGMTTRRACAWLWFPPLQVVLRSNTVLQVSEGATLLFSANFTDYPCVLLQ